MTRLVAKLEGSRKDINTLIKRYHKPTRRRSRSARWAETASTAIDALTELQDIQQEYQDWRDNLLEGLESSPVAEKLDEVCGLDFEDALDTVNEANAADLPQGYGRD